MYFLFFLKIKKGTQTNQSTELTLFNSRCDQTPALLKRAFKLKFWKFQKARRRKHSGIETELKSDWTKYLHGLFSHICKGMSF